MFLGRDKRKKTRQICSLVLHKLKLYDTYIDRCIYMYAYHTYLLDNVLRNIVNHSFPTAIPMTAQMRCWRTFIMEIWKSRNDSFLLDEMFLDIWKFIMYFTNQKKLLNALKMRIALFMNIGIPKANDFWEIFAKGC